MYWTLIKYLLVRHVTSDTSVIMLLGGNAAMSELLVTSLRSIGAQWLTIM